MTGVPFGFTYRFVMVVPLGSGWGPGSRKSCVLVPLPESDRATICVWKFVPDGGEARTSYVPAGNPLIVYWPTAFVCEKLQREVEHACTKAPGRTAELALVPPRTVPVSVPPTGAAPLRTGK